MNSRWILRGTRVLGGAQPTDLFVDDGVIVDAEPGDAQSLDADGLIALPGLVDLHTHLREPGREDKETVETGSRAAAIGGFTAVSPMANTDPVADNAAVIHEVLALGERAGLVDLFPVGAITRGLAGEEMAEIGEMVEAGVRVFSDDGRCVPNARVLRNAMTYAKAFDGIVIAEHCGIRRSPRGVRCTRASARTRSGSRDSRARRRRSSSRATSRSRGSPADGSTCVTSALPARSSSCGGRRPTASGSRPR